MVPLIAVRPGRWKVPWPPSRKNRVPRKARPQKIVGSPGRRFLSVKGSRGWYIGSLF